MSFQFSYFFTTYFGLVLMATMIICGWFAATRGWEVELPDGRKERKGKLFKAWYFFWFQEKGSKRRYFENDSLYEIGERIKAISNVYVEEYGTARLIASESILPHLPKLRYHLKLNLDIEPALNDKVLVTVFKEYPNYLFPEWIRDPLAGCITCFPTVYGNLIFWVFAILAKYTNLNTDVYVFLDMSFWGLMATWIGYWLTLAFTCTLFWNYMPD
ncbi:MAG TPA: hypothetical protein VFS31_12755 [Chitinophagaceae bacterium]|nr:hypothetical protein [Chitinophagaceae bacterium]